jgi:nucleoid-associated protein YgaU
MRSVSPYERYGNAVPLTDASLRVHTVITTDTISLIAERYLGDWREWRAIAERNGITDVRQLTPGTELIIPSRQLETGAYEST